MASEHAPSVGDRAPADAGRRRRRRGSARAATVTIPTSRRTRYTTDANVESLVRRCVGQAEPPNRRLTSRLNWVEPTYFGVALALVVVGAWVFDSPFDLIVPIAMTVVIARYIIYTPDLAGAMYAVLAAWVLYGLTNMAGGTAAAIFTWIAMVLAMIVWRLGTWASLVWGSALVAAVILVVGWRNPGPAVVAVVTIQWLLAAHHPLFVTRLASAIVALGGLLTITTIGGSRDAPVLDAASAGIADLLGRLPGVDVPPSRVWLVVAAALYLAWHRALEMRNDGRGAHAVELRLANETSPGASTVLASVQRTLRRASIGAPPDVPGERLTLISEIEQTVSHPSTSAIVAGLRAAAAITIPHHGLIAEIDVEVDDSGGMRRVGYVLLRRRDGHIVSTHWADVDASTPTLAAAGDAIGHALARHVWTRSSVRPRWEVWRQRSGRDLALYSDAVRERTGDDTGQQTAKLVEALSLSPGNGLIRLELASRRETTRSYWEALRLYLTIVLDHPALVPARYRLAVVLLALGADLDATNPPGTDPTDLPGLVRAVRMMEEKGKISEGAARALLDARATTEDRLFARLELVRFAMAELTSIQRRRMRVPTACRALLDQRQRRQDFARLVRPGALRHERLTVRTARAAGALQALRLVADLETAGRDVDPTARKRLGDAALVVHASVERATRQMGCGWQAHYNAACFYSRILELDGRQPGLPLDDLTRERRTRLLVRIDLGPITEGGSGRDFVIGMAFEHLDRAVRSPDSGLSRDAGAYYRRDRDLLPLREAASDLWRHWEAKLPPRHDPTTEADGTG